MPSAPLRLDGIVPPLVTPLADRDQLDVPGLERLLEHVISGGVAGLFLLGTTGEAPSLSYRLRRELITRTVELVGNRIPVLVGITDTSFVESVALADHAANAGASALVLTTPYYFPAGQTELIAYVRNIAPLLPLPLLLYNMPGLTKVWFEIESLKQLLEIQSIIGIKDSSGDLDYFSQLCQLKQMRNDWSVLLGPEAMLIEGLDLGSNGGVCGGANIAPHLFVDCYSAYKKQDQPKLQDCLNRVLALQQIYEIGKYASRHIKATKSALSILGICNDLPADPFHRFLSPQREQVAGFLRELELL